MRVASSAHSIAILSTLTIMVLLNLTLVAFMLNGPRTLILHAEAISLF